MKVKLESLVYIYNTKEKTSLTPTLNTEHYTSSEQLAELAPTFHLICTFRRTFEEPQTGEGGSLLLPSHNPRVSVLSDDKIFQF